MSSKSYVLKQIKDILQEDYDYSEDDAEGFIKEHRNDKVYELLVIKKDLRTSVPDKEDVSISTRLKN